jgi:energy-coupling factor transport system permease protein
VNVAPRYLGRGSWLARRDPRVLILVAILAALTVPQVFDLRIALVLLVIGHLYYRSAGIPFSAVKAQWAFVFVFLTIIVLFNTIITSGEIANLDAGDLHVLFRLPLLGTPISAEALAYGPTQMARYLTFTSVGFPIAFAVAPSDLGPAFARLGVPYKFAFGVDLTFRFIPSLADDLQTTVDAQRVRGYDPEKLGRGPIGRLRRLSPVIVPLTINAIVNAEDTIDAMDLRAFGTGKRTWLRELVYERADQLILAAAVAILVIITVLNVAGYTRLWTPQFLIDLATGAA